MIERSVGSPFAAAAGAAAIFAAWAGGCAVPAGAAGWPGAAGAEACWLVPGEGGWGLGAKYFAQTTMTIIESSDATRMRSCGLRPGSILLGSCAEAESLTGAFRPSLLRYGVASRAPQRKFCFAGRLELPKRSPERDRSQICRRTGGTAISA